MKDFIEQVKTGLKVLLVITAMLCCIGFGMICGIYYGRFDMLVELEQRSEDKGGAPVLLYREDLSYD